MEHTDPAMGPLLEGEFNAVTKAASGPGKYEVGQRVAFRRLLNPLDMNMATLHGTVIATKESLGARYYHVQPDGTTAADESPAVVAEANIVSSLPMDLGRDSVEKWLETPEPR